MSPTKAKQSKHTKMTSRTGPLLSHKQRLSGMRLVGLIGSVAFVTVLGIYLKFYSHASTGPALGVYQDAGCDKCGNNKGPNGIAQFSSWLNNAPVTYGEDFVDRTNWTNVEGPSWQLPIWQAWKQAAPAGQTRKLIYSVGWPDNVGDSLAIEASGADNAHWTNLAKHLVADNLADSDIRLFWEFNGSWEKWWACNNDQNFINAWHQVVSTMRAVPGQRFTFDWNPTLGGGTYCSGNKAQYPAQNAYPGDAYVDYIGLDVYDQSYSNYPTSGTITAAMISAAWSNMQTEGNGLNYYVNYAAQHGKPLTIPEWGVYPVGQFHGAGDDPTYIQNMHDWMFSHNVVYQSYFDVHAGDGDHELLAIDNGTAFPNAAAKFKSLFGLASSAPPPVQTYTVSVTAPPANQTVNGTVSFTGTQTGAKNIEIWYNGSKVAGATISGANWTAAVDTTKQPTGSVNYVVYAWDVPPGQTVAHQATQNVLLNVTRATAPTPVPSTKPTPLPSSVPTATPVPNPTDTMPPSVPAALRANLITDTAISIGWNMSTDNKAVAGYRIYRNGVRIADQSALSWLSTGLNASTAYLYAVEAYDAAGNVSKQITLALRTEAAPAPITAPITGGGGNPIVITPPGATTPVIIPVGAQPVVGGTIKIATPTAVAAEKGIVKVDGSTASHDGTLDTTYLTNGMHTVTVSNGNDTASRQIDVQNNLNLWQTFRNSAFSALHGNKTLINDALITILVLLLLGALFVPVRHVLKRRAVGVQTNLK